MEESRVDLLIMNAIVVTVDDGNRVFDDGAIAVRGDRIVDVGPSQEVAKRYVADRVIDAHRMLAMPGLVDTYAHAGHGMIKGIYRAGIGWPTTEVYFHGSTPDWWHADGLLTAVERVKYGVTTGVSIMGATPARADRPDLAERNAEAVETVGLRSFIGIGPPDPFIFRETKPWTTTSYEGDQPVEEPFTYEQTIEVSRDVIGRLKGKANGRVQTMLAVPYLCGLNPKHMKGSHCYPYSDEDVQVLVEKGFEAREIAEEFDVIIHTHGARGTLEWAWENYGPGALEQILGEDVIFGHANGLTDLDVSIMRQQGCAAAAVPFAPWNTYLGACPVVKLIQNGVRVAIATDGAAPYFVSDLFIGLHRTMFLQWMENHDMSLLPSGRTVRLATVEAAALLGMEDEIGSLEVGKKADVILVDINQPHLTPFKDPANMIAWYVRGNDVDTVIIDGAVVMEGRQMLTVDEEAVLEFAREEIEKSFERVDVSEYLHHDEDFWSGWRSGWDSRVTQDARASEEGVA